MPIYEFVCKSCSHSFELITDYAASPACPKCSATALQRRFSTFAVASHSSAGGELESAPSPCGTCGDPRGPGSCDMDWE